MIVVNIDREMEGAAAARDPVMTTTTVHHCQI